MMVEVMETSDFKERCGAIESSGLENDLDKNKSICNSRRSMTVGELIGELYKMPKDATVVVCKRYDGHGFSEQCTTYCSDNGKHVFIEG